MEFSDTFYLPINKVSRDKQFKNEHNVDREDAIRTCGYDGEIINTIRQKI